MKTTIEKASSRRDSSTHSILNSNGCLTDHSLCFYESYDQEQKELIDRHLKSCASCYQHNQAIKAAKENFLNLKPKRYQNLEARILRLNAMRVFLQHLSKNERQRLQRKFKDWSLVLLSLSAILLALLLLLLSGCEKKIPTKSYRASIDKVMQVQHYHRQIASAAKHEEKDYWALGQSNGEILLVKAGKVIKRVAPTSRPTSSSQKKPIVFRKHHGVINALAFNKSGNRLLSAGGKDIVYWDISSSEPEIVGHLRGPQRIQSALLGPNDKNAYFSTNRGYVLRWPLDTKNAEVINNFSCRIHMVNPNRLRLSEDKRCPFGIFDTNRKGKGYCAFPATHLTRYKDILAVGCRDGYSNIYDLRTNKMRYRLSTTLGALSIIDNDTVFFARSDRKLQHFEWKKDNDDDAVFYYLSMRQSPILSVADKEFIVVATTSSLSLIHKNQKDHLAGLKLNNVPIWIKLHAPVLLNSSEKKKGKIEIIYRDGAYQVIDFSVQLINKSKSKTYSA